MVESGEKKAQESPSAEELAMADQYEDMLEASAREDDDDYDLEDEDCDS